MLPLPAFSLEVPDTLSDAVSLAAEPEARIVAGGTDLLPSMKHRLFRPRLLVSLSGLQELRGVRIEDGALTIGASCTLLEVLRHPLVRTHAPALAAACHTVGTHTLRAMGTLGGNLMLDTRCLYYNQPEGWRRSVDGCLKCEGTVCHVAPKGTGCYATHSADTVPALWLLGASVVLHGPDGVREVAVPELYDGSDGRRWLTTRPGEVLARVKVPLGGPAVSHQKVRVRQHIDYGQLLVAVSMGEDGASAVVSAVGPAPLVVHASPTELAEAAWQAARPLSTHAMASTWRKHMVRVAVGRGLAELGLS